MTDLRIHADNAATTLSASLSNSALSISVTSDTLFPSWTGSQYSIATITDGTNIEQVKITAKASNVLTIASGGRAQAGTSAQAWPSGASISINTTKDSHDRKQQDLDTYQPATVTVDTGSDMVLIQDASDSYKVKSVTASSLGGGGGGGGYAGDDPVFTGTGGIGIPHGNTGARPSTDYMARINTDSYHFEARVFGTWTPYVWDADLPTGLITKSAALTYAACTFGANQLSYASGVLSIADDAVMPGHAGITLPSGSTASRGSPAFGKMRMNTSTGNLEISDGSGWFAVTVTSVA